MFKEMKVISMEDMIFSRTFPLTAGDFDCYDRLKPYAILNYFQEVAGIHSVILGAGYEDLLAQNKIWVLLKTRYQIESQPHLSQTIKITTWPLPVDKVYYGREYLVSDEAGNDLIKGSSIWAMINLKTESVTLEKWHFPGTFVKDRLFEDKMIKHTSPAYALKVGTHPVMPSEIDHNRHMNNAFYANIIYDSLDLGDHEEIRQMEIHFESQAKKGTVIEVYRKDTEVGKFVFGKNFGDSMVFQSKTIVKNL
jgi:acyl-ACP thioesterase